MCGQQKREMAEVVKLHRRWLRRQIVRVCPARNKLRHHLMTSDCGAFTTMVG